MQANATKRRALIRDNGMLAAGSACRSKMRVDEAKAGRRAFNGKHSNRNYDNAEEEGRRGGCRRLRRNQSDSVALERKRMRNCTPSDDKVENSSIRKAHSDLSNSRMPMLGADSNDGDGGEEFVDKKMDLPEEMPMRVEEEEEDNEEQEEEEVLVVEEEEEEVNHQNHEIPVSARDEEKNMNPVISSSINAAGKKHNPVTEHSAIKPDPVPHFKLAEERSGGVNSLQQNRMQSIVNLVMWRDVSRSAFVFGSGTFVLGISSYAKDINFSLISASSYLGLFYLAFVFLRKSILRREEKLEFDERGEESYMVGEEEAIWLLKMLLPYVNELLLKMKSLFSGDPATTLKLALALFVMARCGSSITIWSLAKLIFFAVFTVPKICSSYSAQLGKFGEFWLERFSDGWEACTHKKAVATAIFILIWNISSTVARIWTFFMVVVAVKLYQQCVAEYCWRVHEEVAVEQDEGEEQVEEEEEEEEEEVSIADQVKRDVEKKKMRRGCEVIEVTNEG